MPHHPDPSAGAASDGVASHMPETWPRPPNGTGNEEKGQHVIKIVRSHLIHGRHRRDGMMKSVSGFTPHLRDIRTTTWNLQHSTSFSLLQLYQLNRNHLNFNTHKVNTIKFVPSPRATRYGADLT